MDGISGGGSGENNMIFGYPFSDNSGGFLLEKKKVENDVTFEQPLEDFYVSRGVCVVPEKEDNNMTIEQQLLERILIAKIILATRQFERGFLIEEKFRGIIEEVENSAKELEELDKKL